MKVMLGHAPSEDFILELGVSERDLLRRHRVRLVVEKVTPDGRNALCVAGQFRSRFLRQDLDVEEVVDICHTALSSLYRVGLSPLIGAVDRQLLVGLKKVDPNDPYHLRSALMVAGLTMVVPTHHH